MPSGLRLVPLASLMRHAYIMVVTSQRENYGGGSLLGNLTEQGIRNAKDFPKRKEALKEMAKKQGATVKDVYWTLGQYDIVFTLEAPG